MKWQQDPRLWTLIQQVLTVPEVRREIVGKGANNYLKERGVDLPIDIDLAIDEETNSLNVKVTKSGKNFKGSLNIEVS